MRQHEAMTEKDYILRMIWQMGQVLIAIRNTILGTGGSSAGTENQLKEVATKVGFDLTLARAATPETIWIMLAPTGEVEPGRCWLVAEVLYLDGLQAEAEGRDQDAVRSYQKALPLYRILEPGALHLELPEAAERIREIEQRWHRLAGPDVPELVEGDFSGPAQETNDG
jgi:hypothetical protein